MSKTLLSNIVRISKKKYNNLHEELIHVLSLCGFMENNHFRKKGQNLSCLMYVYKCAKQLMKNIH